MHKVASEIDDKVISIETGKVARQADGSVWVQCGGTVTLVTAVSTPSKRDIDFLPLTVEYREKAYATGRIPGGFFKREGRPNNNETLVSRLIDRPLRPLFPKGYNLETQIISSVFSADGENNPDVLSILGASAALHISDIPFDGPIAAVRIGLIDGKLVINPSINQLENSEIDLVVAGSRDAVTMVEGGARTVDESVMLDAVFFGHESLQPLLDIQEELRREIGKPKCDFKGKEPTPGLREKVRELTYDRLAETLFVPGKIDRRVKINEITAGTAETIAEEFPEVTNLEINSYFEEMEKEILRKAIAEKGKRLDGRVVTDVRSITCETGVFPQTHGSALFTRGETQVLATVTLGTREDEQKIESLAGEWWKTFIVHYNFPPYSVGEVRMRLGPGRREVGHGALAERALEKVIPPHEEFPYTIRVVSEVLESNGSSSMGTVCSGSMALMHAGIPVRDQVAGIAMGLIKEGDDFFILSDIMGDEDHYGDMDFKVAGTRKGVTALQMDIKIAGINREIMAGALEQAKEGRLHILDRMDEVISKPQADLSPLAPRISTIMVPVDRIKDVIGPGGKHIKNIVETTGANVDVEDDGTVRISSINGAANEQAIKMIEELTAEAEVGRFYMGTVQKVTDFGAFVEIFPGTDGLVHISRLDHGRVNKVTDVLREGDGVLVKCIGVDNDGKISLSREEALGRDIDGNVIDPELAGQSGRRHERRDRNSKTIEKLTAEVEVDRFYMGTVQKVTDFGAFVEILPGTDGLVHISRLDHGRVDKVTDVLREGDEVLVKCIGVDNDGKISLSREEALGRDIDGNVIDPELAGQSGGRHEKRDRDSKRRDKKSYNNRRR